MPPLAAVADGHYRRNQTLAAAAAARVMSLWDILGPAGFKGDPARAAEIVAAAQYAAADGATTYVDAAVAAQGGPPPLARWEAAASAFAGATAAGRPLGYALAAPAGRMYADIAAGRDPVEAQMAARARVGVIAGNEVQQAAVNADHTVVTADARVRGYVRMLRSPSCPRCAVLAGRVYRWSAGFQRHPQCFPAGVTVSGPASVGAARRWYEGELVTIRTASGKELPATANHPILTDRGWLPAHLLQVGDNVVGSTLAEGAVPLVVPHEQQMPTRIEDAFGAFGVGGLLQMPTAAEDFHGDGGHGDVHVVTLDGFLWDRRQPALAEPVDQVLLAGGSHDSAAFAGCGGLAAFGFGLHPPAGGFVGGGSLRHALLAGHLRGSGLPRRGMAAGGDPGFGESPADGVAGHVEASGDGVLALAALVGGDDLGYGQGDVPPRWDAPAGPFTVESRGGYADRGQDLALRLSSQVQLDRVVEVGRVGWSGHVWNLTSEEGWYSANGVIVSNCDCVHVPALRADSVEGMVTDPRAAFDALTEDQQDRIWGKQAARAVRDGADPIKVVNLDQRGAGLIEHGVDSGGRRVFRRRLTVGEIYGRAGGDRDAAVRLLQSNGYIRNAPGWDVAGRRVR